MSDTSLNLCSKHKQEWKQSHFAEVNCDHCKLERQLTAANARVKELEDTEEFYKASMVRIAKEFGIDSPLQLIARATDDSQTYVDILLLVIQESKRTTKANALEEAAEHCIKSCNHSQTGVEFTGTRMLLANELRAKAAAIRKGREES